MNGEVFVRTHPERLWLFLLPAPFASAGLAAWAVLGGRVPPGWTVLLVALTLLLAGAAGLLAARELPQARGLAARARQIQAVYEVISKAGAARSLQEVLDAITRLTVEVTGVRGCSIKLLEAADGLLPLPHGSPSKGVMHVRSLAGIHRELSGLRQETAENIYAQSLLDGRPVLVEGAEERDFPELDGEVESLVCVPLRREGIVLGAMCLYSEKGSTLSPEVLSFLSRLGDLVSISIENAAVADDLRRVDEARTWFLMKASHELKAPLSAIQSICQTLLQGYLGEMAPRQRDLVERVRLRAAVLFDTAMDLLALARARSLAPGVGAEKVELCGVLEETVRFYRAAAEEKRIRIDVQGPCVPCSVTATLDGVRSVMTNLLSNAVKYSPPGSSVTLSLEPSGAGAVFTVRDQGIGIPPAEREGLFREFFRATNARSFTEAGTGLGLAIVRSLVTQMGGSIDVDSEVGRGTTMRVTFGTGA